MKLEKLKEVAHNILTEEIKNNKLDVYFKVLTIEELDKFRKLYEINKNANDCFYSEKENTIVIVINEKEDLDLENLYDLVSACFHEIRHVIQKSFPQNSYEGFFNTIDYINSFNYFDYDKISHDGYSFEIGANLYSIKKTKEYLKNNQPEAFNKYNEEIDIIEQIYKCEYLLYNAPSRFNIFMSNFKKHLKMGLIRWSNQKKQGNQDIIIPDILEIFLNYDGTFKPINQIINHENFNKIDKRIIYSIFSSKAFLKSININKISKYELLLVEEALNYTKLLNQKQLVWRKDLLENRKKLHNYRIKNKNAHSGNLYRDLLLYGIRFNNFYKKDSEFFRKIVLKRIYYKLNKKMKI